MAVEMVLLETPFPGSHPSGAVAGRDAVGGLNLVDEGVAGGEDIVGFSRVD